MRQIQRIISAAVIACWSESARPEAPQPVATVSSSRDAAPVRLDLAAQAPRLNALVLQQRIARGDRIRLFDVRSSREYGVSHLRGSQRLDADTDQPQFVARINPRAHGLTLVFYCTTSGRSQAFANGILHDALDAGANDVFVLAGGIVAWSNARLPLVWRGGPTNLVHPHDPETAKLLERDWLVRYEPR